MLGHADVHEHDVGRELARRSSTASAPSPASPTTSMSSWASRIMRKPAAHERLVVGDQDADHDRPARAAAARAARSRRRGRGAGVELAAVERRALAHADQAVAAAVGSRPAPAAVVDHLELERPGAVAQRRRTRAPGRRA